MSQYPAYARLENDDAHVNGRRSAVRAQIPAAPQQHVFTAVPLEQLNNVATVPLEQFNNVATPNGHYVYPQVVIPSSSVLYPAQQYTYTAESVVPVQAMSQPYVEPSRTSAAFIIRMLVPIVLIIGLCIWATSSPVMDQETDDQQTLSYFLVIYCSFIGLIVAGSLAAMMPKSIELHPTCAVLRTRMLTYSVPYERVERVEVVGSLCCYTNNCCRAASGIFTTYSDGIYIRSVDFRQSLRFSPENPERFLAALQQSPLASKIRMV